MARIVCSRSASAMNVAGVGRRGGWRNIASAVIRAPGFITSKPSNCARCTSVSAAVRRTNTSRSARRRVSQANRSIVDSAGARTFRSRISSTRAPTRTGPDVGAEGDRQQPPGQLAVDRGGKRTEAEVTLEFELMLTAGGVPAMQIGSERRRIDTQLTGERGHDLRVSLLTDAQHPTGQPGIAELDGEAELSRVASVAANQLEVGVGQGVEARQSAVVEWRGEVGELDALGWSEQLAGGHEWPRYGVRGRAGPQPASRTRRRKRRICCGNTILELPLPSKMTNSSTTAPARICCDDVRGRPLRSRR